MSFALITAVLTMAFAVGRPARGGEIVDCVESPGSGRWVYRIVDERRCWFPAGRLRRGEEKPLEELRWPKPIITDPLSMDLTVDGVVEHQKDGITRNEDDAARHLEHPEGEVVFRRLPVGPGGDRVETPRFTHRSGRSPDWVKFKTPDLSAAT